MNDKHLQAAWDSELANKSFVRWQEVAEKSGWRYDPSLDAALIKVFGASWYFTRFVFFRGDRILPVLQDYVRLLEPKRIIEHLYPDNSQADTEQQFATLRIRKNDVMLAILLAELAGKHSRESIETALTHLAITAFRQALNIYFHEPQELEDLAVLGMGRMSGMEMNYGSDLDLVILCYGELDERMVRLSRQLKKCLRTIAYSSPEGLLYEIDTRLRPHGNSGTLITRFAAFKDYHLGTRETWEKQMMTRCRLIVGDEQRFYDNGFQQIIDAVYRPSDNPAMAFDIREMRQTVEQQLGSPPGKYDIKKGKGGLMDIDFICHYLQLKHGITDKEFRTHSSREILRTAAEKALLDSKSADSLLQNYDYLKAIEARLRVFDMKAIDTIDRQFSTHANLARSMGYANEETALIDFENDLLECLRTNRELFQSIVT